ncbi:MAG: hypothetical protein RDV48_26485 [Candidatus Eremiobacteraeota bacterium]|nr:hypothetical protein [Candidatus Eremiobacteraeota bacterium]
MPVSGCTSGSGRAPVYPGTPRNSVFTVQTRTIFDQKQKTVFDEKPDTIITPMKEQATLPPPPKTDYYQYNSLYYPSGASGSSSSHARQNVPGSTRQGVVFMGASPASGASGTAVKPSSGSVLSGTSKVAVTSDGFYHRPGCSACTTAAALTKDDAKRRGFRACTQCRP